MKAKGWMLIAAVIFAAGLIGSAAVLTAPAKDTVRIISAGEVVETIDLRTAEDRTLTVEYQGHFNIIEIQDHQIRVKSADCPDQTCVHMGVLRSAAAPVVCLPHRLVIAYTDSTDAVDAVTR